jgi:hypothetical protein
MIAKFVVALAVTVAAAAALLHSPGGRRVVIFPAKVVEIDEPVYIQGPADVRGANPGAVLKMARGFKGAAAIIVRGGDVRLSGFTIDGNRAALEYSAGLPLYNTPFAHFTPANGILAEGAANLRIEAVRFREISGFAVLVNGGHGVSIDRVEIRSSGSRNPAGANNATGGILLEEGVREFSVTRSLFGEIRGNALWTHSLYTSARNAQGLFARNRFEYIGRDAIQVGHAADVRVEENSGRFIGFPTADVDIPGRAFPVAIDTAGNVERSIYAGNRFEEIGGKCIDLDGFHDGEVRDNVCVNHGRPEDYRNGNYGIVMNNANPDMRSRNIRVTGNIIDGPLFGGIFVIGSGHLIAHNRLLNINTAHCNEEAARFGCYYAAGEPDMLRSGIYLGRGAERPALAQGNIIEDNEISGFKMRSRCVALAPGIKPEWNTVRRNACSDREGPR